MKCPICGNEFGNGANCQNCGVDKVTAFAKYDGYSPITSKSGGQVNNRKEPTRDNIVEGERKGMDVCRYCGEIIPIGAKFCPACGETLLHQCPKCGEWFSAQYGICPECGTIRDEYLAEQERKRVEEEEERKWKEEQRRREEEHRKKLEEMGVITHVEKAGFKDYFWTIVIMIGIALFSYYVMWDDCPISLELYLIIAIILSIVVVKLRDM